MKVVVDANVWLAAFDSAEPGHLQSTAFLDEAAAQNIEFVGPVIVLVEVAAATLRKSRISEKGILAMKELHQIPGIQFLDFTLASAEEAGESASRLFLKGADSIYVTLASELEAELVTLDREIQERAAGELSVFSPAGWLARNVPTRS